MTTTIRAAISTDIPTLLTFVRELAEYEREPHAVSATESLMHAALFGPTAHVHALLAELDGAPVGFALYFFNFSTWLGRSGVYLEDLYVRPAARGIGVGRQLFTEVAKVAIARGCGRMDWSVLSWNSSAIGFYRKLGAVTMEDWKICRLTGDALAALAV
jgi:GNAT superfamily N-acetyltransferase